MRETKYYLVEVTTYMDGTKDAYGVYPYDTKDLAVANFHSKMGGAMKNENYATELLTVLSGEGSVVKTEFFERPIPTPDPEPEVEGSEEA